MAVVSGPPVLRPRHQRRHVLLQRGVVELFAGLGAVEVGVHEVGHGLVLVQDGQVQLLRSPLRIGLRAGGMEGTLGRFGHLALLGGRLERRQY